MSGSIHIKAMVWLCANDDERSYKKYMEKFGNKSLFPDGDRLLAQLYERYDRCSKVQHGSIYSLAGRINYDFPTISFNYFEVDQNPRATVTRYHYILSTHRLIIALFAAQVFADEVQQKQEEWDVLVNSVDAKIGYHRRRWAEIIPQPAAPEP